MAKRQRELAKAEKRQEKAEKKALRKAQKAGDTVETEGIPDAGAPDPQSPVAQPLHEEKPGAMQKD